MHCKSLHFCRLEFGTSVLFISRFVKRTALGIRSLYLSQICYNNTINMLICTKIIVLSLLTGCSESAISVKCVNNIDL